MATSNEDILDQVKRCRICKRACTKCAYPVRGAGSICRACAVIETGLTVKALKKKYGIRIENINLKRKITLLKNELLKSKTLVKSLRDKIHSFDIEIISLMIDSPEIYEREMVKHGNK